MVRSTLFTLLAIAALLLLITNAFGFEVRTATLLTCPNQVCVSILAQQTTDDAGIITTFLNYAVYVEYSWQIIAREPGTTIPNNLLVIAKDASSATLDYNGSHMAWSEVNSDYTLDVRSVTQSAGGVITKYTERDIQRPVKAAGSWIGYTVNTVTDADAQARIEVVTRNTIR